MFKKKAIGLSILLLVLLLGLSTTTYAFSYILTQDDINTVLAHYNNNYVDTSLSDIIYFAVDRTYNFYLYDTCVFRVDIGQSYNTYYVYGFNKNTVTHFNDSDPSLSPNYWYINTDGSKMYKATISWANNRWNRNGTNNNETGTWFGSGSQIRTVYVVCSNDLGSPTIKSGPFESSDVLNLDDYFTFLLSSTLQTFTINGDSVPYFNFNSNTANDYHLGMLGLAEHYDYAELFEYRYKQGAWKLNRITRINNIGPVEQNLISVDLPGRYFASNTLYSIQFNPDPDSRF